MRIDGTASERAAKIAKVSKIAKGEGDWGSPIAKRASLFSTERRL